MCLNYKNGCLKGKNGVGINRTRINSVSDLHKRNKQPDP